MKKQITAQLYDRDASIEFYQQRYSQGYMDDWPSEKKRKVTEVIHSLNLPKHGSALDLGCGNGVFTDVIKKALPGWDVYGTDISASAVNNALERYPDCRFFMAGSDELLKERFDFILTHHVLEHVYDLSKTIDDMDQFLDDSSSILHILPCGNEGSFEHGICLLRKNGIDKNLENRFFFDDEGHVRRLSTDDLCGLYAKKGFLLRKEYYSNQHYGAINWITKKGIDYILNLTDNDLAVNKIAARALKILRYKLLAIWALRYPTVIVEHVIGKKNIKDIVKTLCGYSLYVVSKPIDLYLNKKAELEWQVGKRNKNGSEMFLYFKK